MTGVLWMVQALNYPFFKFVEPQKFFEMHQIHSLRITFVVGPVMLLQLASAFFVPEAALVCVLLTLVNFAFTFFVSVPLHNKLEKEYDVAVMDRLIQTNWPRTVVWSAHSLFLLVSL
jgi:hypothetical protein